MDNNFPLRFLPDLLSDRLSSLNIAAEHHHLGAPPAHVEGGELADASVAPCDCHNLAIQSCLAAALGSLYSVLGRIHSWKRDLQYLHKHSEEEEKKSKKKDASKKATNPGTRQGPTLKSHNLLSLQF